MFLGPEEGGEGRFCPSAERDGCRVRPSGALALWRVKLMFLGPVEGEEGRLVGWEGRPALSTSGGQLARLLVRVRLELEPKLVSP